MRRILTAMILVALALPAQAATVTLTDESFAKLDALAKSKGTTAQVVIQKYVDAATRNREQRDMQRKVRELERAAAKGDKKAQDALEAAVKAGGVK